MASDGKTRSGTADRVASVIRDQIATGLLSPGQRLSEERIGGALGVARNTLREAFRALAQERLVVHVLNRGVFVRELTIDDIVDLYRLRRAIEGGAVRMLPDRGDLDLEPLYEQIRLAQAAALKGDWAAVGTADLQFHSRLVDLAGSERLSEVIGRLQAELRIAFHMATNVNELHERYLLRNQMLLSLLEDGDMPRLRVAVDTYLDDSQADVTRAYARAVKA